MATKQTTTVLKLVIQKGPREGETYEYNPGRTKVVRIGRVVKGNNLAIKDAGISSKHMAIEFNFSSGKWVVFDLGSSNGTVVNGCQLSEEEDEEVVLCHGDVVKIGELTCIRVEIVVEESGGDVGVGGRTRRRNPRRVGRGSLGIGDEKEGALGMVDGFGEKGSLGNDGNVGKKGTLGKGDGFGEKGNLGNDGDVGKKGDFGDKGSLGNDVDGDGVGEKGEIVKNYGFGEKGGLGDGDNVGEKGSLGNDDDVEGRGNLEGRGRGRGRPRKNVENERGEDGDRKKEEGLIGGRGRGMVGVRRTRRMKRGEGDGNGDEKLVCLEDVVPARRTRSVKNVVVESVEEKGEMDGGESVGVESKKTRRGRGRKKKVDEEVEVEEGLSKTVGVGDVTMEIEEKMVVEEEMNEDGVVAGQVEEEVGCVEEVGQEGLVNEYVVGDAVVSMQTQENVMDDVVKTSRLVVGEERGEILAEVVVDTVQESENENAVRVSEKVESEDVIMEDRVAGESETGEEDEEEELDVEEDGGESDEVPVPDLEKMTLGQWFDYLEVLLPKQIYAERDKVIADMREKAKMFDEYVLQQLNEKGNRSEVN